MKLIRILAVLIGVTLVGAADAKTLTWSGGSSGSIATASNWGGTAPAAGDTLVFTKAVTLTGSFGFGSSGVTLNCNGKVTSQVVFSGAGVLTKTGAELLTLTGKSTYSGGTLVSGGGVSVNVAAGAGTGKITVDRSTSGATSYVLFDSRSGSLTYANAVYVKGTYVNDEIGSTLAEAAKAGSASAIMIYTPSATSASCTLTGAITGDGSISMRVSNTKAANIKGTVTVPEGKKIIVAVDSGGTSCNFYGAVYGSLVKYGSDAYSWNSMSLRVPSGRAGDSLTTHTGPIYFYSSASWAGSTVVVTNLASVGDYPPYNWPPTMYIQIAKPPLSSDATLYFDSRETSVGNKPVFSNSATNQVVKALRFDGSWQGTGVYLSGDLDGYLSGSGSLIVGKGYTWKGGASGRWSEAKNWDPAGVPGAGSTVFFTNVVKTAKETVDIGDEGISISSTVNYNTSKGYANLSNDFVGAGAITKFGTGGVQLFGKSTYTGTTTVLGGTLTVEVSGAILPNPVLVMSRSDGGSMGFGSGQATVYTNDINIVGTAGSPSFVNSNSPRSYGNIVSEDDFTITCSWAGGETNPTRIYGTISAPGKTVSVGGFNSTTASGFYSVTSTEFDNDVDASIVKGAFAAPMIFANGTIGSRSEKLTIQGGTNIVRAAAHMAFTNIVLKAGNNGAYCSIRLESSDNVEEDAELRLTTAAVSVTVKTGVTETWTITPKIVVQKNVRARVGRVIVDDVDIPAGTYRGDQFPWLGGEGRLIIGTKRGLSVIVR